MKLDEGTTPDPPRSGEGDRSAQPSGGGGSRRINPEVLRTSIKQVKRARKLRREMSLPEVLLWQQLRKKPAGLRFRRQFPIGPITADFACLERRLMIEIDGEAHRFGDQPRRDAARDALLRREGFRVIRIAARDVLKDMDVVLRFIVATCSEVGPLHHDAARRGSPPRSGEDVA